MFFAKIVPGGTTQNFFEAYCILNIFVKKILRYHVWLGSSACSIPRKIVLMCLAGKFSLPI